MAVAGEEVYVGEVGEAGKEAVGIIFREVAELEGVGGSLVGEEGGVHGDEQWRCLVFHAFKVAAQPVELFGCNLTFVVSGAGYFL